MSLNLPIGTNRCYCRSCEQYFSTVRNFTKHRNQGECRNPADLGMVKRNGVWKVAPALQPDSWKVRSPEASTQGRDEESEAEIPTCGATS